MCSSMIIFSLQVKCEQYWSSGTKHYENITVTTIAEIPLEDWTIRDFSIKNVSDMMLHMQPKQKKKLIRLKINTDFQWSYHPSLLIYHLFWVFMLFVHQVKTAETRPVRQFHFTAWPDHGVPETTELLISFRHLVREHMDQYSRNSPTVVHCRSDRIRAQTHTLLP